MRNSSERSGRSHRRGAGHEQHIGHDLERPDCRRRADGLRFGTVLAGVPLLVLEAAAVVAPIGAFSISASVCFKFLARLRSLDRFWYFRPVTSALI